MKFTAMIIDDEQSVREGLCQLIDWQGEEWELLEPGVDGVDGLARILREQPDLVLVDIKMPGLSGLEVIRQAHEHGIHGSALILTGYSDFEYAKTAISMGVEGYLLKPIDEDELLEYVRKIHKRLEHDTHLTSYHRENEEKVREDLIRRILLNMETMEWLEKNIQMHELHLDAERFSVAVCRRNDRMIGEDTAHLLESIRAVTRTDSIFFHTLLIDGYVAMVGKDTETNVLKDRLLKYYGQIVRNENGTIAVQTDGQLSGEILFAIGSEVHSWKELSASYENAKFLLDQSFLLGTDHILTMDDIFSSRQQGKMESAEQLEMMIEVGNEDGIHQSMKCIRDYCIWHLIKEADFKIILTRDLMKLKLQLEKKYGSKLFSEEELQKVLKHIMRSEQLSDALNRFEQLLLLLSNRVGADSSDNIIPRVYHYMEMNYQKDLKLEGIAKSFNYNSAYLGKLFRREMGDSFNNALDSIRISNARRLLEETDYKVYQISELVGYSSIDYFYTKFKKYVGISPKQYRRNLPGSKEEEDSGNK